jgi:hypothetical protein
MSNPIACKDCKHVTGDTNLNGGEFARCLLAPPRIKREINHFTGAVKEIINYHYCSIVRSQSRHLGNLDESNCLGFETK